MQGIPVRHDDLREKIRLARQPVAFAHLEPIVGHLPERDKTGLCSARQGAKGKDDYRETGDRRVRSASAR